MRNDTIASETLPNRRGASPQQMCCCLVFALLFASVAHAQFSAGSNESDGALDVPANQGTIVFDPRDSARWGRTLDPDGDGVYHFTSVNVGSGTTLVFSGDVVNTPVTWLASGNVTMSGTLRLNGAPGTVTTSLLQRRAVAIPGSGGYRGGAGGRQDLTPPIPSTPGEGAGGGSGGFAACTTPPYSCGRSATFTGNRYVIPLVGGSGGEGALWLQNFGGGGAGGGAILVASSTSVTINGLIAADGGNGATSCGCCACATYGGGGGGGTIRIVAPNVLGSGSFSVRGGSSPDNGGDPGWIRLEGFQVSGSFGFLPGEQRVTRGAPVDPATLRSQGTVRVTAIGGLPVPVYPSGKFTVPDVSINTASPVSVDVQATGIPPGTTVILRVFPDTPQDPSIIDLPPAQATLQGTLELSTASVQFVFPYGFSRGYVSATWTQ